VLVFVATPVLLLTPIIAWHFRLDCRADGVAGPSSSSSTCASG